MCPLICASKNRVNAHVPYAQTPRISLFEWLMSRKPTLPRLSWSQASCFPVIPVDTQFERYACAMQVLFLDSDNVAVADPESLFHAPEYTSTGALLWPDYWTSTAAPDLAAILGVPALPAGTFESGQMVFDKQRCVLVCGSAFLSSAQHSSRSTCRLTAACW